jgi:coproporphyrinogen III oxidase-like Fe-S oxidoreductase
LHGEAQPAVFDFQQAIKEEFGIAAVDDYREPIADLVSRGLLEIEDGWLRLTAQGRLLSNEVFAAFLRD